MKLNDQQRNIVISAGEFELSPEALAYKMKLPEEIVFRELSNTSSEMSKYYEIGRETQLFDVYTKMREEALDGKAYASKMMIEIKQNIDLQKAKRKLFGT